MKLTFSAFGTTRLLGTSAKMPWFTKPFFVRKNRTRLTSFTINTLTIPLIIMWWAHVSWVKNSCDIKWNKRGLGNSTMSESYWVHLGLFNTAYYLERRGGLMVSALDSGSGGPGSSPGRGTALCSWARHFTLIVPLSTQVYKWVPVNLLLGVTLRWTSILSRGSRNTPSRFMLRKPG